MLELPFVLPYYSPVFACRLALRRIPPEYKLTLLSSKVSSCMPPGAKRDPTWI
jgi:hypothetical protein